MHHWLRGDGRLCSQVGQDWPKLLLYWPSSNLRSILQFSLFQESVFSFFRLSFQCLRTSSHDFRYIYIYTDIFTHEQQTSRRCLVGRKTRGIPPSDPQSTLSELQSSMQVVSRMVRQACRHAYQNAHTNNIIRHRGMTRIYRCLPGMQTLVVL